MSSSVLPKEKAKRIVGILVPVGLSALMATFTKALVDKSGNTWLPISTDDIIENIENVEKYTASSASSIANIYPVVVNAISDYFDKHPKTIKFIVFTSDIMLMNYIGVKPKHLGIFVPSAIMLKDIISNAFDTLAEEVLNKVKASNEVDKFVDVFAGSGEAQDETVKECIECKEQISKDLTDMIENRSKFLYTYKQACSEYSSIDDLKTSILDRLELREMYA